MTDKRGYPAHTYDTCTYYDALGRIGCTAEEASQAIRRVSNAVCAASHAEGQYTQALNSMSHAVGRGIPIPRQKEKDSLFSKNTLYHLDTGGTKPVRADYEGEGKLTHTNTQPHSDTHTHIQQEGTHAHVCNTEGTDIQQHSDTHTHIQQEDTTHVYNTEDTHYYTSTDSVIDTHILTHHDVMYDTQEIDTYIHSMIDIH